MSYEDVINIINAHYGWSMGAHEPEYKGEIKEKMQAMKQLVRELQAKAKAFDEIREARKEVLSDVRERGLKLPTDLDKFSMMTERIINKYESGESDAKK